MRFKKGDKALTDKNVIVTVIGYVENDFYKVKYKEGFSMAVHDSELIKMPAAPDKPAPLKMTLALEETLKEIIKHLNDGNYELTEQYVAHDYSSINKSHDIKITMVLKENK